MTASDQAISDFLELHYGDGTRPEDGEYRSLFVIFAGFSRKYLGAAAMGDRWYRYRRGATVAQDEWKDAAATWKDQPDRRIEQKLPIEAFARG